MACQARSAFSQSARCRPPCPVRVTKEYRRRFFEVFGHTRCGDLLRAKPGVTDKNPASQRLGVTAHCDNMIVTAVELLEALIQEEREGGTA